MPGFRAGKVPTSLVKKMAGKSILSEEIMKKLNKNFKDILGEDSENIIEGPLTTLNLDEKDVNLKNDIECVVEFAVQPEFDLDVNLSEYITLYDVEVDEAFLERELEFYLRQLGTHEEVESFEMGDSIYGWLRLPEDNDGTETEEDETEAKDDEGVQAKGLAIVLNPLRIEDEAVFETFANAKPGDKVPFNLSTISEDRDTVAKKLVHTLDELEVYFDKDVTVDINKIQRSTPAEMNEETYKKAFRDKEILTETEFREELEENVKQQLNSTAQRAYIAKVQKGLIDLNPFELSKDFFTRWREFKNMTEANSAKEKKEPESFTEADIESDIAGYRWTVLVQAVQKLIPELNVTNEEIREEMAKAIRSYFPQELGEEQEEMFVNQMLENSEQVNMLYNRLIEQRFLAAFDSFHVEKKQVTATEFVDIKFD